MSRGQARELARLVWSDRVTVARLVCELVTPRGLIGGAR